MSPIMSTSFMKSPEEVESKLPSVFKFSFLLVLVCFLTLLPSLMLFFWGDFSLFSSFVFFSSLPSPKILFFSLFIFWCKLERTRFMTGPVSVSPLDLLLGDFIFDVFLRQTVEDLWLGLPLKGFTFGLTLLKGNLNCFLFFFIS